MVRDTCLSSLLPDMLAEFLNCHPTVLETRSSYQVNVSVGLPGFTRDSHSRFPRFISLLLDHAPRHSLWRWVFLVLQELGGNQGSRAQFPVEPSSFPVDVSWDWHGADDAGRFIVAMGVDAGLCARCAYTALFQSQG